MFDADHFNHMSIDITDHQKRELVKLLTKISRECELEALGIVNRQGISLAFFVGAGADKDLLSAISAAITSTGESVTTKLQHGNLNDMLIRGDKGFTILATAGEYILIGASKEVHAIGLTLNTIRESVPKLREILN
ncbi:MAG: hypothetical protein D6732_02350 [Methanobacteriota archaeon]|nr:MAG: hypothetical protein D6732_02350 [Euryarchaeota archaeon]